jgi:hypothetical protein
VDAPSYYGVKSGINILKTRSNYFPIATIISGAVEVMGTASHADDKVTVYYIANGTEIDSTTTTVNENPAIDKMIIDYATAQAKASDDELNAWQMKLQEYQESLMAFNFSDVPVYALPKGVKQ